MSDKDLQRVTESLSDIGQVPQRQNPPLLQLVGETFSVLTQKEEAFALAIVEGHNKSDAYRRAYKPQRGSSPNWTTMKPRPSQCSKSARRCRVRITRKR